MIHEFHLSPPGEGRGVSCDANGAFIGDVPLLKRSIVAGKERWEARECGELSKTLGANVGLPIDMSSKMGGVRAIANALNEGNVARAQIATVLLGIPDLPVLSKGACSPADLVDFIHQLQWSGLIKADWDPDEHPRWPAGAPDSQGGQFAPKGDDTAATATDGGIETAVVTGAKLPQDEWLGADLIVAGQQGSLHAVKAPPHTVEMDSQMRATLFNQEIMSHAGNTLAEKSEIVQAFDADGNSITLVDQNGHNILAPTYQGASGNLIVTINDYAAANGSDDGSIGGMHFFTTRDALNSFLDSNPGWEEKYGDSNPNTETSYIFAGAVNPGWTGTSFVPAFWIGPPGGQLKLTQVAISAAQMADVVYWHELSHLPPINNQGTQDGESQAWIAGFDGAHINY